MHSRLAKSLVITAAFCGSIFSVRTSDSHPLVSEFTRVPLGYQVSAWYPIDINHDSLWELAITCGGTPTRAGIFSPKTKAWLDGPHVLPVISRDWGVRDYDTDGLLEYTYVRGDTVRLSHPSEGTDSVLWVAPFDPVSVVYWGTAVQGAPLVGLEESISFHSESWRDGFMDVAESQRYVWHVFDLVSGAQVRMLAGGNSHWQIVSDPQSAGTNRLVLHHHEDYYRDFLVSSQTYIDTILQYDSNWEVRGRTAFPTQYFLPARPSSPLFLSHFALVFAGIPLRPLLFADMTHPYGYDSSFLLSRIPSLDETLWFDNHANSGCYAGLAAYDLHGDGVTPLYLPLNSGEGWEVRALYNGSIVDTLFGMPKADLQTGPLLSAIHQDLFYIADSNLYIWGMPTSVTENQSNTTSVPTTPALTAYPNPFNSGVRFNWSGGSNVSALEIFNVLGQRLRTYDLHSATSMTTVEWNGTDDRGRSVPSGLYFARLTGQRTPVVKKLVLLK